MFATTYIGGSYSLGLPITSWTIQDISWLLIYHDLWGSCCCSVSQSCPTLCNPMDYSTPGFPVLQYSPEFAQTHVHWISDAIQPSHPLSPPSPLAFNLPSIRVFSSELALCIRWPKYWSFSFSISPSSEYSGLISFRIDQFDLLADQGTLKRFLQHHSSKESVFPRSAFFMVQLSHLYVTTEKTMLWLYGPLLAKWYLCFLICSVGLSEYFLPRSKHLWISWLQSPSTVILEPKKIKSVPVSIVSPSICHEVMGLDVMIFVFWMLSFKPAFHSPLSPSSRDSLVRACHLHMKLLIFSPVILIPAWDSSSLAFCTVYFAYNIAQTPCSFSSLTVSNAAIILEDVLSLSCSQLLIPYGLVTGSS